jgi:hypothetical protein
MRVAGVLTIFKENSMWNTPSAERLAKLPRLYETEQVGLKDKLIYLHFFIGGSDWYAIEFDGQDTFWGFAILNGDNLNAEWGYFSLTELQQIRVGGWVEVDCELEEHWEVRPASNVGKINQANGWHVEIA